MLMLKANSILDTVKEIDLYTYDHLERTAMFTFAMGKALKFNPKQLEQSYFAGLLHDIGVIGTTENDQKLIAHYGSLILKFVDGFEVVAEAIKHQNDFYLQNRSDFPLLLSEIIAISSKYDDLRNNEGLSHTEAVEFLKEKEKFREDMINTFSNILESEELI